MLCVSPKGGPCYRSAIMSASIPGLRSGLSIAFSESDTAFPAVLLDEELGQRVKLDPTALAVAQALDRDRSEAELAQELGKEPEMVSRAVEMLRRLHLLECEETRAFVNAARATASWQQANPAEVPLIIRDDAAFTCTLCGSCCGGHNVGPVSGEVLNGLGPHAAELMASTRTQKGLFFEVPSGQVDGEVQYQAVCHASGGSCIFLTDRRRCLIHQEHGGDKKPDVCRLFPFQMVATPDGVAVSLQMECRGFVEARSGAPLREQESGIREILQFAPLKRVRPSIALARGRILGWNDYKVVEEELHHAVDEHRGDPMAALVAMRATLELARGRDPDAEVERAEAEHLVADLAELLGGLRDANGALHGLFHQEDANHVVHTESLDLLSVALEHMRADMRRVVRPPDRIDQRDLFAEMAHHHLMGKELTVARTMTLGMARLAFGWFCTQALAIHRAREVKRRHLVAQDLVDAMTVVHLLMRNNDYLKSFQRFDVGVESLFYTRLPALVAAGPDLADPDRRLELFKF